MIKHRELAEECGIPEENIHIIENGMILEVDESCAWIAEEAGLSGQVLVDGKMIEGVEEIVLRDRKHLAEDGIITVVLAIDRHSHKIIAGPDIVSRGFVVIDDNASLIEECRQRVIRAFEECDKESQEEWDVVKTAVRKALRKFLRGQTGPLPDDRAGGRRDLAANRTYSRARARARNRNRCQPPCDCQQWQ